MNIKPNVRLNQILNETVKAQTMEAHFTFESPTDTPLMMHSLEIDNVVVGYVATEDFGNVGAPHIFVYKVFRTSDILEKVSWLFTNVYCPLMKALGKTLLATNCDRQDVGTINFLKKAGFDLQKIMVAQYIL